MAGELTKVEQGELDGLVTTVKRGLATFIDVGNALRKIRDAKLWRANADSFESFCEVQFGFGKRRANQIIGDSKPPAISAQKGGFGKSISQSGVSEPETKVPAESPPDAEDQKTSTPADDKPEPPNPEPWLAYNKSIARAAELMREAGEIVVGLVKNDGPAQAFAGWIDPKQYRHFFDDAAAQFSGHKVTGWASEAEKRKRGDDRVFNYACDSRSKKGVA